MRPGVSKKNTRELIGKPIEAVFPGIIHTDILDLDGLPGLVRISPNFVLIMETVMRNARSNLMSSQRGGGA